MAEVEECARVQPADPIEKDESEKLTGTENTNDTPEPNSEEGTILIDVKKQPDIRDPNLKPIPVNHVSADDLGETFFSYERHLKEKLGISYSHDGDVSLPKEFETKPYIKKLKRKRKYSDEELSDDEDESGTSELELMESEDGNSDVESDENSSGNISDAGQVEKLPQNEQHGNSGTDGSVDDEDDACDENLDLSNLNEEDNESEAEQSLNENEQLKDRNDDISEESPELDTAISEIFPTQFEEFSKKVKEEYSKSGNDLQDYFKYVIEKLCKRTDYKRSCAKILKFMLEFVENFITELPTDSKIDFKYMEVLKLSTKQICMKNSEISVAILKETILHKFGALKSSNCLSLGNLIFVRFLTEIFDLKCKGLQSLYLMVCFFLSKILTKAKLSSMSDLRNYLLFTDFMFEICSENKRFVPEVVVAIEHVLKLALSDCPKTDQDSSNIDLRSGFLQAGLTMEKKSKVLDRDLLLFSTSARMKQTPLTRFQILHFAFDILVKCKYSLIISNTN